MGACMAVANSSKPLMEDGNKNGSDKDYYKRFIEDKVLGSGSFGEVKQVYEADPAKSDTPYACKILHKGLQFKGNTLYTPINRSALRAECVILRTLNGDHFTIKLEALYENSNHLWLVMEFCAGGEMMQYMVKQKALRTEDVSRISFQLLDAINHCEKHGVIHRDLKPENVMFKHSMEGAPLRLIDFGSSCISSEIEGEKPELDDNGIPLVQHSTFAGSAFYISPELFQRTYTYKTDIWSAGVTLYVLVAGFPAEKLQKAFNTLHTSKDRDLRSLPGLDNEDLPDSYFDMLDQLLRYRHKQRKCAKDMLEHEFVQFHKVHHAGDDIEEEQEINVAEVAAEAANENRPPEGTTSSAATGKFRLKRTTSTLIRGTVERHTMYMGYQTFERSVTALLATLLSKDELSSLIQALEAKLEKTEGNDNKLRAIRIHELKEILESLGLESSIQMIDKLPNSSRYDDFSYRVPLLLDFVRRENEDVAPTAAGSGVERAKSHTAGAIPSSVHGNDVFEKWRKGSNKKKMAMSARNLTSKSDDLNFSSHI